MITWVVEKLTDITIIYLNRLGENFRCLGLVGIEELLVHNFECLFIISLLHLLVLESVKSMSHHLKFIFEIFDFPHHCDFVVLVYNLNAQFLLHF